MTMTKIEVDQSLIIIEAVVLAIYNQPSNYCKEVYNFDHASGVYFGEKRNAMINNFGRWWGTLDWGHRVRAIDAAMDLYGAEATERVNRR